MDDTPAPRPALDPPTDVRVAAVELALSYNQDRGAPLDAVLQWAEQIHQFLVAR